MLRGLLGCACVALVAAPGHDGLVKPPVAEQRPLVTREHGRERVDVYAWLRDREDPAVRAYLEAENRYAEAVMEPLGPLREQLYEEMLGRLKEEDDSVPLRMGPYLYYQRMVEGKNYPLHCRKPLAKGAPEDEAGAEEVYLDQNALAQGHDYFSLRGLAIDTSHRFVAYSVDLRGDERFGIRVIDLHTGAELPDCIEGVGSVVAWAADERTILYTKLDHTQRPYEVWLHEVGTPAENDVVVFTEQDPRFHVSVRRSRSDRFVYVDSASRTTSESWVIDARAPRTPARVVAERRDGVEYSVADHGEHFFIRTNASAVDFKVVRTPIEASGPEQWEDFIEHREGVLIEQLESFSGHIVVCLRRDGLPGLHVYDPDGTRSHEVQMPDAAYYANIGANRVYSTTTLRFDYGSFVTPHSVFDYDMNTRECVLRKRYDAVGYDPATLTTQRCFAVAPDGVRVPISIVRPKDAPTPSAMLLTVYGAYGRAYDGRFNAARLSLLQRGVAVAIAHVRGGGELGRRWYEAGKMLRKPNTFTDCIAVAEHLIEAGHARADGLSILGGSAGGLVVGAVLNARPDLFTAAIADVPFVDVLNTMLDETLPLTANERDEWGDPRELAFFEAIGAYAPYDNVTRQRYPHVLALAGWNDPRVGYWEAAKWVAKLRTHAEPGSELLLRTDFDAGHAGPSGRYGAYARIAFIYAFLLRHLGVPVKRDSPRSPG